MILTLLIVTLAIAVIAISWLARSAPLHPLFWLPPFAFGYTCIFSISKKIDIGSYGPYEGRLLLLGSIAFTSALLAAGFASRRSAAARLNPVQLSPAETQVEERRGFVFEIPLFYSLCTLCVLSMVYALASGYVSKRELNDYFMQDHPYVAHLWIVFIVLSIRQVWLCLSRRKLFNTHLITVACLATLYWLVMGQREAIFGIGLVWLLLYMYRISEKYRVPLFYSAIIAFTVVEPITASFKAVLVGDQRLIELRFEDYLYPAPYSGATRNLEVLIDYGVKVPPQEVLHRELMRPISVMGFGRSVLSMSAWYNTELREDLGIEGTSGWGFTLVGSGLLLGGIAGIVFVFLAYGTIIGLLFRFSTNSFFWITIYLYVIPFSIYVLRQDFSYFISSVGKQALIPMVFLTFVNRLIDRK